MTDRKLKTICLQVTPELRRAIDEARGAAGLSESIEAWLWRLRAIREAAKALDLEVQPDRPPPGRRW